MTILDTNFLWNNFSYIYKTPPAHIAEQSYIWVMANIYFLLSWTLQHSDQGVFIYGEASILTGGNFVSEWFCEHSSGGAGREWLWDTKILLGTMAILAVQFVHVHWLYAYELYANAQHMLTHFTRMLSIHGQKCNIKIM